MLTRAVVAEYNDSQRMEGILPGTGSWREPCLDRLGRRSKHVVNCQSGWHDEGSWVKFKLDFELRHPYEVFVASMSTCIVYFLYICILSYLADSVHSNVEMKEREHV